MNGNKLGFIGKIPTGFTLVELLVVISIISLLSSTVLSSISNARNSARIAAGKQFEQSIRSSISDCSVAFYNFEGDNPSAVREAGGTGPDATKISNPSRVDGITDRGQAMEFDGSDDAVDLDEALNYSKDSITVSAWFKQTGNADSQYQRITANDPGMWVNHSDGQVCIRLSATEAGASSQTCFLPDVEQGQFHHIAFSYDSAESETRLYLDGGLVGTSNYYSGLMNGSSDYFTIGNRATGYGRPWRGLIDNVRIYDCAFKGSS